MEGREENRRPVQYIRSSTNPPLLNNHAHYTHPAASVIVQNAAVIAGSSMPINPPGNARANSGLSAPELPTTASFRLQRAGPEEPVASMFTHYLLFMAKIFFLNFFLRIFQDFFF